MNWGWHTGDTGVANGGIMWYEDRADCDPADLDDTISPSDTSTDCLIAQALLYLNTAEAERAYRRVIELLRVRQESVGTLRILMQRTPPHDLTLKCNLLRLLGALERPDAASFLAQVATRPLPGGRLKHTQLEGELRVRTMAVEALLQIATRHPAASESLLRVIAARPPRPILVEALKAASELGLNARVRRLLPEDDPHSTTVAA